MHDLKWSYELVFECIHIPGHPSPNPPHDRPELVYHFSCAYANEFRNVTYHPRDTGGLYK